jgi:hypothetical protein
MYPLDFTAGFMKKAEKCSQKLNDLVEIIYCGWRLDHETNQMTNNDFMIDYYLRS